jgi:hypothetical protein
VGGGRWKYDLVLNASQPEVDDVIEIEAALNRSTSIAFSLANAFDAEAEYEASFTSDSPTVRASCSVSQPRRAVTARARTPAACTRRGSALSARTLLTACCVRSLVCVCANAQVFAVRPARGVLPRAGSAGQQFVVSFSPVEYGKTAVGTLLITTAEMQWAYEVRAQAAPSRPASLHRRESSVAHPRVHRRARARSLTRASRDASPPVRLQVHGKPPVFVVPEAKKRIDDRMHPELERRMLATKLAGQTRNYVRKNMNQAM